MTSMLLILLLADPGFGTFSIVARDPATGELGVAVASRVVDAGYIVPWLKTGAGAIASQALANPFLGVWGIEDLAAGRTAEEVLKDLLARDSSFEDRQIGIVDKDGRSAAFTGKNCSVWAGHKTGENYSIQGNILTGPEVVDSMTAVYLRTTGPLAERLLAALEAGEKAGGDKRGKQSAALYVVVHRGGYQGADDRLVDLKIVDLADPVKELRRLYELWQFTFMAAAYIRLSDEIGNMEQSEIDLARAYELMMKALKSGVESAEVFNSLAWEFAVRKKYPKETVLAANLAHELAPDDPNIMDTVAEAYFAAGDKSKAIYWEKEALKRDPENEFFKGQLKKFQKK
jgi:uncharacterized Ntn-hydrolase superfamily protein